MNEEYSGPNSPVPDGMEGELDGQIRFYLSSLVERAAEPDPFPVERLHANGGEHSDPGRIGPLGRRSFMAVAAALVILLVGVGVWINQDSRRQVVTGDAARVTSFYAWKPGWHAIDPGPVPAMQSTTLLSVGGRIIVAGVPMAEEDLKASPVGEVRGPSGPQIIKLFAFDPIKGQWSELPSPPGVNARVVAYGDELVAVVNDNSEPGGSGYRWVTLDLMSERGRQGEQGDEPQLEWDGRRLKWQDRGEVQVSSELSSLVGVGGFLDPDAGSQLISTGDRIIDVGLGSVLDPSTGEAMELALPPNFWEFIHLQRATPQWTGERRLIFATWGSGPGLSWNSLGSEWSEIPGAPIAAGEELDFVPNFLQSTTTTWDGQVVLVAPRIGKTALAAKFDPRTGDWTSLPDVPKANGPACRPELASIGREIVVQPCPTSEPPLTLDGDRWVPIETDQSAKDCCDPSSTSAGGTSWLGAEDVLFTWSTRFERESPDGPWIPHRQAAVWVPGHR
ncbi:MAG: hypothetical protein WBA45_06580 [Microthrixaceae bacterium]